jgi:hypothetical protein
LKQENEILSSRDVSVELKLLSRANRTCLVEKKILKKKNKSNLRENLIVKVYKLKKNNAEQN